jgi:hypothetical protein
MMYVKGEIIQNLPIFIKEKFGEQGLSRWKNSLSWQATDIYSTGINDDEWYPLRIAMADPVNTVCKLYYLNSLHGAIEYGWFLAEHEKVRKRGLFPGRISVKSGSPIDRACEKLRSCFQSPDAVPRSIDEDSAIIQVKNFPENDITEVVIAGWLQRTIKREHRHNPNIEIRTPHSNSGFEYWLDWKTGR